MRTQIYQWNQDCKKPNDMKAEKYPLNLGKPPRQKGVDEDHTSQDSIIEECALPSSGCVRGLVENDESLNNCRAEEGHGSLASFPGNYCEPTFRKMSVLLVCICHRTFYL
jgi:hypothetical protein